MGLFKKKVLVSVKYYDDYSRRNIKVNENMTLRGLVSLRKLGIAEKPEELEIHLKLRPLHGDYWNTFVKDLVDKNGRVVIDVYPKGTYAMRLKTIREEKERYKRRQEREKFQDKLQKIFQESEDELVKILYGNTINSVAEFVEKPKITNCKNCGAPLHGRKCEFCDTEYQ